MNSEGISTGKMAENKTLIDFLLDAKKKAEEAKPVINEIAEQDPMLYRPIYGYVIAFSSN